MVIEQGKQMDVTVWDTRKKEKSLNRVFRVLGRWKIQTWPGQRGLSPREQDTEGLSFPLHPQFATSQPKPTFSNQSMGSQGEIKRQRATTQIPSTAGDIPSG